LYLAACVSNHTIGKII